MVDIKSNKNNEYRNKLINFMNDHRYNPEMEKKPTHQSWGNVIIGKFYIDSKNIKEFMDLYTLAIKNNVDNLSILEIQKEYSPIIVDIDLKKPSNDHDINKRLYDDNLIKNIITKYIKSIKIYLDLKDTNENELRVCVFEKNTMTHMGDILKDGFHIVFPDLCADTNIRHLIRHNVVESCKEESIFEDYLENADKIIDKCVVSSNGWFLYGSVKPGGYPYNLSQIYNFKLEIIYTFDKNDIEKFITLFSIHNDKSRYSKKNKTPLLEELVDSDIHAEIIKLNIDIKPYEVTKFSEAREELIMKACKYVSLLNDDRASNYEDWRNVGLALHNTDTSLLSEWIEFSKKCHKKFNKDGKQGNCYAFWSTFKNPSHGNLLTIRSLAYWAKQDNPKEFDKFQKEEFKNHLTKSLDNNTYTLAKAFHIKYADRFVCSSARSNIWWEFKNHRWNRIEEACSMKLVFSQDFSDEYNNEKIELLGKLVKTRDSHRSELDLKIANLTKITDKLKDISFKNKLVEECKCLFLDQHFEEKLDSNINLIGYNNGVYDLTTVEEKDSNGNISKKCVGFRDGRPDDYISLSTKNDFIQYSSKMPYIKNINTFFSQILPNEKIRNYFLQALSTCLSGETKEEKLYILTGSGSNGKSLTMDLMYAALGDYYMSCPITIITRKRGQSNETSPEKVRMKGRRCGVFQETDDGEKLNVGVMKEFTGGDKVLVRDLFKGANEMIEFKPQMKYFLTCNQLPTVPSNDDGTWRRLRVIEFGSKFTDNPTEPNEFKINTNLKQEIKNWSPYILAYILHIYITQYKGTNYLKEPEEVMASTNQYKSDNNLYAEFFMEKLTITKNSEDKISGPALYDDFKIWFKALDTKTSIPRKTDFIKFMSKIIGELSNGFFSKVIYTSRLENHCSELDLHSFS